MAKKDLIVKKVDDFVIWEVSLDDCKNDTICRVEEGCQALYIKNGQLYDTFYPSKEGLILSKKEKKEKAIYRLIGVASDKKFTLRIGVGGVQYFDEEIQVETNVGSNADLSVSIANAWKLRSVIGKNNITMEDVINYLRGKLSEIYKGEIALLLSACGYLEVNTKLDVMADDLIKKINAKSVEIGLLVDTLSINEVFFNEEYKEARRKFVEEQKEKKAKKEKQREERSQMEFEAEIIKGLNQSMTSAQKGQTAYCRHCGAEVKVSDKICPKCGKVL